MANKKTKPLNPSIIAADRASLAALRGIQGYKPANPALSVEALTALQADMDAKADAASQAEAEARSKRDDAIDAAWAYHEGTVSMKDAVGAQFGKASNEFQEVGRKKTTEYKKPTRRPKTSDKPTT